MRVAIMQPYFFPYIGYFQLIYATDRFILLDDVQYIRHGWINRNRILKPGEGVQYITVPLAAHHRETLIKDIGISDAPGCFLKILRQLEHYRKRAPYYKAVMELLRECFNCNATGITALNAHCLETVCRYIGLRYHIEIAGQLHLDYTAVQEADEWALQISRQLGASEYINPPGGSSFFNRAKYEANNIQLWFLHPHLRAYDQGRQKFEPGLSIIDVMMFNTPEQIRSLLQEYELT
jgi:hypothetical protein